MSADIEHFVAFPVANTDVAYVVDENGRVYRSIGGQPFVRIPIVRRRDNDDDARQVHLANYQRAREQTS